MGRNSPALPTFWVIVCSFGATILCEAREGGGGLQTHSLRGGRGGASGLKQRAEALLERAASLDRTIGMNFPCMLVPSPESPLCVVLVILVIQAAEGILDPLLSTSSYTDASIKPPRSMRRANVPQSGERLDAR